jgi:hypothetical protein
MHIRSGGGQMHRAHIYNTTMPRYHDEVRDIRYYVMVHAYMSRDSQRTQIGVCVNMVTKESEQPHRCRSIASRAKLRYPSRATTIRIGDDKGTGLRYLPGTHVITATKGDGDLISITMALGRILAADVRNRALRLVGTTSIHKQPQCCTKRKTPNRVTAFRMPPADLADVKHDNPDTTVYSPHQFPGMWGRLKHLQEGVDAQTKPSAAYAAVDPNALHAAGAGDKNNPVFIVFTGGCGHATGTRTERFVRACFAYIYDTLHVHRSVSPPVGDTRHGVRIREYDSVITNNVESMVKWRDTPDGVLATQRMNDEARVRDVRVLADMHAAVRARPQGTYTCEYVQPIDHHLDQYGAFAPSEAGPGATRPITVLDEFFCTVKPSGACQTLEEEMRDWYRHVSKCPTQRDDAAVRPYTEDLRAVQLPAILRKHGAMRPVIADFLQAQEIVAFLAMYMRGDAYAYYREPYREAGWEADFDWRMGAILVAVDELFVNVPNHESVMQSVISCVRRVLFIWSAPITSPGLHSHTASLLRTYADRKNYAPFPPPANIPVRVR